MTKNKWFRFLNNFKYAWSFAKLENKYSSTGMTAYEKVASFDVIQSRYLEEIEDERNYLKTLWHIYSTYIDNPEKLKEELRKFLEFWDDCCDCTDGKIMPYKEEMETDDSEI